MRLTSGKSRVRESRMPGSVRAKPNGRATRPRSDIVARLRSFAYNLLRADGCDNIRNARWRAALDIRAALEIAGCHRELNSPALWRHPHIQIPFAHEFGFENLTSLNFKNSVTHVSMTSILCVFAVVVPADGSARVRFRVKTTATAWSRDEAAA